MQLENLSGERNRNANNLLNNYLKNQSYCDADGSHIWKILENCCHKTCLSAILIHVFEKRDPMCKCIYACKDQMGYLLDMKKKVCIVHISKKKKKAILACSCPLWNALPVLGYPSNLTTLHYFVGLGMLKATTGCPRDNRGVYCLMGK